MSEHLNDDALAALATESGDPRELEDTRTHLHGCGECAVRAAEWRAVRAGTLRYVTGAPRPTAELLDAMMDRVNAASPGERKRPRSAGWAARRAWVLLGGQVPVVRREIWSASALVLMLGLIVGLSGHGRASLALSLAAPLVAALGVSAIYGPEVDPALEVALATPTSARVIVLVRLTLIVAYDLVLTLVASAVIAAAYPTVGLAVVIGAWLGPMLALCAVCLLIAVAVRPAVGAAVAVGLWALRTLAVDDHVLSAQVAQALRAMWVTGPATLLVAVACIAMAVVVTSRQESLA